MSSAGEFGVLKEVRPVETKFHTVDDNYAYMLLRLPESDQVKSNIRKITIDYQWMLNGPHWEKPLEFEVMK